MITLAREDINIYINKDLVRILYFDREEKTVDARYIDGTEERYYNVEGVIFN